MVDNLNGVQIDEKTLRVLDAINKGMGNVTTSTVKRITGIESNEVVKYRFRKLEQAGILELEKPPIGENRVPPPIHVELTSMGRKAVKTIDFHEELSENDDSQAAIEDLSKTVRQNVEDISELEEQFNQLLSILDDTRRIDLPSELCPEPDDGNDEGEENTAQSYDYSDVNEW